MIVGVDFGTSNCCLSYKGILINDENFNHLIPTQIEFSKSNDTILYGNNVINTRDSTVITDFKRLIGLKYIDLDEQQKNKYPYLTKDHNNNVIIQILYNNKIHKFSVSEIIVLFFKYLISLILTQNNVSRDQLQIVLTVPAYYIYEQRQILQNICDIVNIKIVRIINEPTAAALAYGVSCNVNGVSCNVNGVSCNVTKENETVLVLDSGGGTTDISLINIDYDMNIYEVITVFGDNYLGGVDITHSIMKYVIDKTNININSLTTKQIVYILKQCEIAKHCLCRSSQSIVIFLEEINGYDYKIHLSYTQMINLNKSFFEKIKTYINDVCFGYLIDRIVFVGGTTKIPYFKTMIENELRNVFKNKHPIINSDIDPMTVVSIGASYQGMILDNNEYDNELVNQLQDITLFDVLNQSIGIENDGGIMIPIVTKNTKIPCEKSCVFTNSESYIDSIDINIYTGERKFIKYNKCIGQLCLTKLDNTLKRGEMQIKITFNINVDGLLTVNAIDLKTRSNTNVNVYVTLKHTNTDNNDSHNNDSQEEEFDEIIQDSMLICKTKIKLELYECLKQMLWIYHEHHTYNHEIDLKTKFKHIKMNIIFNWMFTIIINYEKYNNEYLQKAKQYFMETCHHILLDYIPEFIFDNNRYIADSTTIMELM